MRKAARQGGSLTSSRRGRAYRRPGREWCGMSDHVDHFAPVPLRFLRAWEFGELDAQHVLIGLHLSACCYEVKNTADGVAAIRLNALAELTESHVETARRKMHELQDRDWINFEKPRQGQHTAWKVWLTGLARNDQQDANSTAVPQQFHTGTPSRVELKLHSRPDEIPATPHGETERTSTEVPQALAAVSTEETRREGKRERLTEENYDHLLGKTTAASLTGEQVLELGTLPLGDLHRRHERGEL